MGKKYPCVVGSFSAPGKSLIVRPVTAPLLLPPENNLFGCGEVDRVETARTTSDFSDENDDEQSSPFHFRVDPSYAGSIAVVWRGDCTFEQKV